MRVNRISIILVETKSLRRMHGCRRVGTSRHFSSPLGSRVLAPEDTSEVGPTGEEEFQGTDAIVLVRLGVNSIFGDGGKDRAPQSDSVKLAVRRRRSPAGPRRYNPQPQSLDNYARRQAAHPPPSKVFAEQYVNDGM